LTFIRPAWNDAQVHATSHGHNGRANSGYAPSSSLADVTAHSRMSAQLDSPGDGACGHAAQGTLGTAVAPDSTGTLADFVTSVFRGWRAHAIAFVVLRNYESLPASTSNDIDVLVLPTQFAEAERVMLIAARQADYVLHNRVRFSTTSYFFYQPRTQRQVHVDLFSSLRWHCLPIVGPQAVVAARQDRGLYDVPDPLHEGVITLLTSVIYTGHIRERYKRTILAAFRSSPGRARSIVAPILGDTLARQCVSHAIAEHWNALEGLRGAFRRALVWRQTTWHPWLTVRAVVSDSGRLIGRFIHSPGMTVVLLSNDGTVMREAAEVLVERLRHTFAPTGVHREVISVRQDPSEQVVPPTPVSGSRGRDRSRSLLTGLAGRVRRMVRSTVRRRFTLFRNGLVLIDGRPCKPSIGGSRGHPHRDTQFQRWASRLAGSADCLFLLDRGPGDPRAPGEQGDLPGSCESEGLRQLVAALPNSRIIDATQSVERVACEITGHVLHRMAERARRRWRNGTDAMCAPAE
jgi:hypothetical protein